jgi:hypothetical protein
MKFITSLFLLIVLHTYTFSQLPSYVPKNGLVGYWLFDGNANDISGNNNHGAVKGATLITGRTGMASTAYNFNGNDNTIEVPHNTIFNLDTAFSINLWVKLPTSQVNNPASYVSKYSLAQKSGFVFPYVNEGASGFGLNLTTENGTYENAAGQGQYLTSQISNKTSWHQFTAVFSNGTYKLYVDGFVVKTNSGLGNTLVNNTNNLIFGNSTGYNQFAKGGLDEVGIWNRSLTENEIIALNGCVAPLASITANTSTNICPGTSVLLAANSGSNLIYQWYRNDTLIPNANTISYNASILGNYSVIVKSGPCPTKSSPVQVSFQLPDNQMYNPFNDTVKSCINDVVLDAGTGFTKYLWDDQSSAQKITVKEPGFHKVKITYGNNCVAYDSTYVDLIVQAKIRSNDTTICYKNELLLTNEPTIKNVRYLRYSVYSSDYNYFGLNEFEVFVNGLNIAKNKKIYSNAGWGPESAIDGNLSSGWGSSSGHFFQVSSTTPHSLIIDIERVYDIDSLRLTLSYYGVNSKHNVKVFTSVDSVNWVEIASKIVSDGEIIKPNFYNGYTYKWYKNDNLISSETNRIFHVKYPGAYKLEISKDNCSSTSQIINVKYEYPPTEDGEYDVFQDSISSCGQDVVLDAKITSQHYSWSFPVKSNVTDNGLIGFWPFNGDAKDATGKGNNGVVNGAVLCEDRFGVPNNAYYFNGNASINLGNSSLFKFNSQSEFSMSTWVNIENLDGGWRAILVKGCWDYGIYNRSDVFMIGHHSLELGGQPINKWIFVTYNNKNGIADLYINGILVSSAPSSFGTSEGILSVGQKGDCAYDFFKGKIDDIRIYNRALASSEILQLYNSESTQIINSNQSTFSPSRTGQYKVELTYGTIGCKVSDSTYINYINPKLNCRDTVICFENTINLFPMYDISLYQKDITFQWYRNNSPILNAIKNIYEVKESGSYTLKVTKGSCEATSTPVKITVESPTLNNTAYNPFQDTIVACGKDLVLDAGLGYKSYFWNDSTKTQTQKITKSGSYSTIVEYGTIGCKAKDSVFVDVIKTDINKKDTTICYGNSVVLRQNNKISSCRYIKFESYASADASQVNVYEIEAYSKNVNVALSKNTIVNSGGGGSSVVDGNGFSRWSSNRGDFGGPSIEHPHYIVVDLGSEYDFSHPTDRIVINIDGFDHWKQTFSVLVSSDNNTWLKIGGENDKTGIFTYAITNVSEPGNAYQWYKNNSPISLATQYSYEAKESGSYALKVTKGSCIVISNPINITVESPSSLPFDPIPDTIVSCNNNLVLDAGNDFNSYMWSDGSALSKDTIKSSGNYAVTVAYGSNGCKLSDKGFVQVINPKLNLSDSMLVCSANETKLLNAIDTNYCVGCKYQWYKDGNKLLTETKNYITTKELGTYQLKLAKDKCLINSNPVIIYSITTPPNPLADSLIGCGAPVLLDMTKYGNVNWSVPSNNGSYSNDKSIITTNYSGLYTVQFTFRGCSFSDQVVVSNVIPKIQLDRDKESTSLSNLLCGNEQVKLVNTILDSNFSNPLGTIYNWSSNDLLLSNHSNTLVVAESGLYKLNLQYKSCSVTSDTIRLIQKSLPSNELYFSNTLNLCEGSNVTVKAIASGKYYWSNGITNQSVNLSWNDLGSYFVRITDENGCVSESQIFSITKKTVPSVNICMVTATNNKNLLIWNNNLVDITTLSKYRIYKQNSTNSNYDIIHEQSIHDISEYLDTTSQPSQQISRYKLAIIDSCGNENISANHTTMLLTSNLGINGTVNLIWNPYEGFVYDNFEIWRSENGVDYSKLDQVSNNTFSYIDNNPPVSCFYQLRIENKNGCTSSQRGSYNSVRSNIIDKNGKSLSVIDKIIKDESVRLFPNPSNGIMTVSNLPIDANLIFMDITGKEIKQLKSSESQLEIDLSNLVDNGIYFLRVQSSVEEEQIIKFNVTK